jgi:hypothetical protein
VRVSLPGVALVVIALVALSLGAPAVARAEGPGRPAPDGDLWFFGTFIGYGKLERERGEFGSSREWRVGPTFALEGGRAIWPALSVALFVRLGVMRGEYPSFGSLGMLPYQGRDLSFGPRVDGWFARRRLRLGGALVKTMVRREYYRGRVPTSDLARLSRQMDDLWYDLRLGVVPLRRGGLELELGATYWFKPSDELNGSTSWYSFELGLRWRGGRAATSASAGRRSSPELAAPAAR